MPEVFEDLKLLPIPLDGNLNDPSTPIPEDSAAPIDDQSLDTESQPQDEDNNHLSADGQSQFIPSDTERGDTESDDYPTVTGASGAGRSILISVVVAAVLNKSRGLRIPEHRHQPRRRTAVRLSRRHWQESD